MSCFNKFIKLESYQAARQAASPSGKPEQFQPARSAFVLKFSKDFPMFLFQSTIGGLSSVNTLFCKVL